VVLAVGAFQNLFLDHSDSSRWVYWAVGLPFAALAILLVILASAIAWPRRGRIPRERE
jgi:hypothetical protein